jgi:hypothetical protein
MGDTMRETVEHTIGGVAFKTTRFNPEKSLRLLTRLSGLLGGPIGQAMGAFAKGEGGTIGDMLDELDGDLFGRSLRELFTGIHAADAPTLLREILSDTDIKLEGPNGATWAKVDLNRDFRDSLLRVFAVAGWVLQHNYSNFFRELRDLAGGAGALQALSVLSSKQRQGE